MKKIILLIIILCLFGCKEETTDDKLSKLGYTQSEIETIKLFDEETQNIFIEKYRDDYLHIINHPDFIASKFNTYIQYIDTFDYYEAIKLCNRNTDFSGDNKNKIKAIYNDEFFIEEKEDLYLKQMNNYENMRDCVEAVNTMTYLDYYSNIVNTDTSKDYLMLINKYHALTSDYEPEDLVEIEPEYGRGQVRSEVYSQYKLLQDEANELGYDFKICSAYRSYDYQEGLYDKYLNEDEGGQTSVDTYSARPGHSEHQSGLCLDLSDAQYGMDNFGQSEASEWLIENCYKYGFIIRYTENKEKVTGYQAEPWQIRYVGSADIAKFIQDKGITFDEYYAWFVEE